MCTFTVNGLDVTCDGGELSIKQEGAIPKFVNEVFETTFSGNEASRRGQQVYYVTERCVFRKTAAHTALELIEIAPGIDLQKDVLDQMEFVPVISKGLKVMDRRFFREEKMEIELFGSLSERVTYHEDDHLIFIDLFGVSLQTKSEINWFMVSANACLLLMTDPTTIAYVYNILTKTKELAG